MLVPKPKNAFQSPLVHTSGLCAAVSVLVVIASSFFVTDFAGRESGAYGLVTRRLSSKQQPSPWKSDAPHQTRGNRERMPSRPRKVRARRRAPYDSTQLEVVKTMNYRWNQI
jgi:hypothetical protein